MEMKEHKNDFLEQVKQTLFNHEEPYQEGAWERFVQRSAIPSRGNKIAPLWRWAVAAAILAGIVFLGEYLYFSKNNTQNHTAKTTPHIIIKENNTPIVTNDTINEHIITNSLQPVITQKSIIKNTFESISKPTKTVITVPQKLNTIIASTITPLEKNNTIDKKPDNTHFWSNKIISNDSSSDNIQKSNYKKQSLPVYAKNETNNRNNMKNKKWLSSIYISPLFASTGVSMAYGYTVGYAVSHKLYVSTGISHTKISASRYYDVPMQTPSNAVVVANNSPSVARSFSTLASASSLESVQAYVSGFDVPFELNYHFNNKLYASGGVSGLFILNDKKKFNYVDSRSERITVYTTDGKVKEDKNVLLNKYSSTDAPQSTTTNEKTNFLGFYNFSVGYKQKVSAKNSVSVEPFVKVPMKTVSQQNLTYLGMGLRLKFDF